jgi:7-carboxy-7-deazaguanine synthase
MSKGLRLSELYSSVQGEGPQTGIPTVFVRFGGCNMRCPGWPCDTQHAIQPTIWRHDPLLEPIEIFERVQGNPGQNVCITGGEPTMQPYEELEELATMLLEHHYTIDVFTNGSLNLFPPWMLEESVCIIMDWKLKGSGEASRGIEVRRANVRRLGAKDGLKFVVTNAEDLKEAISIADLLDPAIEIWVGVAWKQYDEAQLVADVLAFDLPWRVNIQVHKYLWPGVEKGI